MSWTIIQQSLPEFAKGFRLTLWLSLVGILGAMVVGIIVSLVRYFKVPYLAGILGAYVELARNTPLLIQLFFYLWDRWSDLFRGRLHGRRVQRRL